MSRCEISRASTSGSAGFFASGCPGVLSFNQCRQLCREYDFVPLIASRPLELSVGKLFRRLAGKSISCLLETLDEEDDHRHSIIACQPFFHVSCSLFLTKTDPLSRFMKPLKASAGGLPFYTGGAICIWGYDLGLSWNGLKLPLFGQLDYLPAMFFFIPRQVAVYDHREKVLTVACWLEGRRELPVGEYETACRALEYVFQEGLMAQPDEESLMISPANEDALRLFAPNMNQRYFEEMVMRVKGHIRSGDVFQAVVSQRWERRSSVEPWKVYQALRKINPSPYLFYVQGPDFTLFGSSPETQIQVRNREVTIRPIAGTCRLSGDKLADDAARERMAYDEKERAEHLMLVDLARNDAGRVCVAPTVKVEEFMRVKSYSHVAHLVSTVKGQLKEGMTALDAFRSSFPAGTLSGAPKRKAMEIIAEQERESRGFYGGAVGYLDFDGSLDSAIVIRSALFRDGVYYVHSGAGIVADSDPYKEYQETLAKARAVACAIITAEGK